MSISFELLPAKAGKIGVILLNRPQALNSLNLDMCRQMAEKVRAWNADPDVAAIFLHGNGEKGFCAGGDVKAVSSAIEQSRQNPKAFDYVTDFFKWEYWNDLQLWKTQKPLIVWAGGITMGGGLGLTQGCSYRITTETSVFAMPEISIGFFPDVGASLFLKKLPPGVGLFLALTGARFAAHDALDLGLMDYFVPEIKRGHVLDNLLKTEWTPSLELNHGLVAETLNRFAKPPILTSNVKRHFSQLSALQRASNLADAIRVLESLSESSAWVAESVLNLKYGSPSSALFIWQLFQSPPKSPEQTFGDDFLYALNFSLSGDFAEGVRALLIDKDKKPKWQNTEAAGVPAADVQKLFGDPFAGQTDPRLPIENPFLQQVSNSL